MHTLICLLVVFGLPYQLQALVCTSDMHCSLNGVCDLSSGVCHCDTPWDGIDCGVLRFEPSPVAPAYGDLSPFQLTSWGGNAVASGGMWHLFVTEIAGQQCGLHAWKNQSTIVHATAHSALGPYTRQNAVVAHEAHNPHILEINGSWYIFHIGTGDSHVPIRDCDEGFTEPHVQENIQSWNHSQQIHKSDSLDGPFLPVKAPGIMQKGCNNPSPFLHPNGTIFLACTWNLRHAPAPEGPWSDPASITPPDAAGRIWDGRSWEDPYLFIDKRGNWHVLAHTYTLNPFPEMSISGHGFSRDGVNWTYSHTEPYSNVVQHVDGSNKSYATLERPKFLFADPVDVWRPTHLVNGVSAVWGDGANPCASCAQGVCTHCKVTSRAKGNAQDLDSTYTMIRPLSMAPVPSRPTVAV